MNEQQLIRRAVVLFPMRDYTKPSSVRHARRAWVAAIRRLQVGGKWVMRDTRGRKA